MRIRVQLKDPDGVDRAMSRVPPELKEPILEKFFKYAEYLLIEIDTETMKAVVIPNK